MEKFFEKLRTKCYFCGKSEEKTTLRVFSKNFFGDEIRTCPECNGQKPKKASYAEYTGEESES